MRELAPAKINLCLYLGPRRDDGYHELLSVMQSIDLCDTLELSDHDGPTDEVRCEGVEDPNLADRAIAAFRETTGWDGPPQLLEITKEIPVAAGLGGGSADAAATLRLLQRRSGLGSDVELHAIATSLGADVPSQLLPGRWLAEGIGERLTRLPDPSDFGVVLVPSQAGLSTRAVYAKADELKLPRTATELERILATLDPSDPEPVNDLAPAARALEPTIDASLARLEGSMLSGSGPTVFGLLPTLRAAQATARSLAEAGVDARACRPVHNSSLQ